MTSRLWMGFIVLLLGLAAPVRADEAPPPMKFNEVREIAPGVFFRYSSISATDMTVPFGGSNNIWVVFEDYVVVIDANFPKEAKDVIEAVKKTTPKPIRYVFDTHHHGDHAYGNAVFAAAGASVIAQANCARIMRQSGAKEFADAGRPPTGRKDIAESQFKAPNVVFDDRLVLDDGTQRIEFHFLGHAHTPGDAVAYLPRHKILCTGDACLNGAFNYTGQSDTASWVRVLERMQQFDVKLVCPGHGQPAGKDLIQRQKRYFVELREQVGKLLQAGKTLEDIKASVHMPWYKDWTGVEASSRKENIDHVYAELTGAIQPHDLMSGLGVAEGPSPTKDSPGWTKPRRIVVPNLMPARLAELKRLAPEVEFIPVKTAAEAAQNAAEADAVVGFCTTEIIKNGPKLRWIQTGAAGVDKELTPELVGSSIVLTNTQRIYGPQVADQAFALLLSLTRGLREALPAQVQRSAWTKAATPPRELHGQTMVVVGLGGVGMEIAKRAQAFGMRVRAVDAKEMERPAFVFSLDKPGKLAELLPQADVLILACPLTNDTKGLIGQAQLQSMKPGAYLINIARGPVVDTKALVEALEKKRIAGAGLDVTDPEPLPAGHALWKLPNVAISPHLGGMSQERDNRQWRLWRENVRRFVAGEPMLAVVDKKKGY